MGIFGGILIIFYIFLEVNVMTTMSRLIRSKRVSGDEDAIPHSKPWVAFLEVAGRGYCHAFLINGEKAKLYENVDQGSSDIMLTAAHCFTDDKPADLLIYPTEVYVYLGKHNMSIDETHEVELRVSKVIIHNEYLTNENYDVAMLKLEKPIKFNRYIKPIALSRYPLDAVDNCSVSGWAGSQNDGLKTAQFPEITERDGIYAAPMLGNSKLENGDSGGPVVCSYGSSMVAQGIVSGFDNTNLELFTIVVNLLPWIDATFDLMMRPHFYNPGLYTLDKSYSQNTPLTHELLQYYVERIATYSPNVLQHEILLDHSDNDSSEIWLSSSFKDSGVYLLEDVMHLHSLVGYLSVEDAHQCVEICYKHNNRGTCTYWAPFRRCYVSFSRNKPNFEISVPKGQVVRITFPDNGPKRRRNWLITSTDEEDVIFGDVINAHHYKPTWNVSIQHSNFPVHCVGRVADIVNGTTIVEASVDCLWELRYGEETFKIYVLDSDEVHVEQVQVDLYTPYDIVKIPVPLVPKGSIMNADDWIITESPIRTTYEPLHGAFICSSKMPWFVRFKKSHSEKCIGVLLNERELNPIGRIDRTRFILTSARCARKMKEDGNKITTITAGVHFRKFPAESARKVGIKNVFMANNTKLPKSPEDFAVFELNEDVIFDSSKRPISLAGDIATVDNTDVFMIDWNLALHVGEPMYVIPVKIISKHSMFTLSAMRLYSKGEIQFQAIGSPLITCKRMTNECSLVGYWSEKSGQIEKYAMVRSRIQWIRSIVDSVLKDLLAL